MNAIRLCLEDKTIEKIKILLGEIIFHVSGASRSSYEDDDGEMQGGKSTATCRPEFQMVNKVAGCIWSCDVPHSKTF